MTVERLVGVNVTDEAGYQAYREGMLPILSRYGGSFTLDVSVSEVLLADDGVVFNRLFTIRFPDEESMNAFFSDPAYLEVRGRHFEPSVASVHPMRLYGIEQ